ncbi:MAG: low temperature requirement protein A [Dermatophilaceae bacterium]
MAVSDTAWARPLQGRDPHESHRASTPLELFLDLTFVVAIAATAQRLHHGIAEGHWNALAGYLVVFFAVWWAWMNFTWFASAYDSDDVLYRTLTFVQMAGVLVLAVGVPSAFDDGDLRIVVLGYVVMRVPQVAQWLRAARGDPPRRHAARRYAMGVGVMQLLWIGRLFVPGSAGTVTTVVLIVAELAVPVYAERRGPTPWHPGHIVERYGLMTIIVLGEVLLATSTAISGAIDNHGVGGELLLAVGGGLLVVFSLWWFYFTYADEERLGHDVGPMAMVWGYGHFVVFASVAAVGAGLAACVDVIQHEAHVDARGATLAVGVPIAAYVITLGLLHGGLATTGRAFVWSVLTAVAVVVVSAIGLPVGVTLLGVGAVLVVALLAALLRGWVHDDPVG